MNSSECCKTKLWKQNSDSLGKKCIGVHRIESDVFCLFAIVNENDIDVAIEKLETLSRDDALLDAIHEKFKELENERKEVWHALKLKTEVTLKEIAEEQGETYDFKFCNGEGNWYGGCKCATCIAVNPIPVRPFQNYSLRENKEYIKKRKPIEFTMSDLEADKEDEEDETFEI